MTFAFACPRCHTPLTQSEENRLVCPVDQSLFSCEMGVWRMLLPERKPVFNQFIQEYEIIRRSEGRGSQSAAYYQALPYQDLKGNMTADWRMRAVSLDTFLRYGFIPYEQAEDHPLNILDLGSGNGWLSNRLARRGHQVAAIDLATNDFDGLGCYRYYETHYLPVQAEFDQLPFVSQSVDMVIFNAALHYAMDYEVTLRESLRVLAPSGRLVILDTPFYHNKASGEMMVQERQRQFKGKYGFSSNALASENFMTYQGLAYLAEKIHLSYQMITPYYGIHWVLRPWKARLLGRREPAHFHLVVLYRRPSGGTDQ